MASFTQNGRTVGYTYGADRRVASVTYPTGMTIAYTRNDDGQVTEIRRDGVPIANYSYHSTTGLLTQRVLANGVTTSYTYTAMAEIASITVANAGGTLWAAQYTYNAAGNRIATTHADGSGDVYQYDAIDQITGAKYGVSNPGAGFTHAQDEEAEGAWSYDASGNRSSHSYDGASATSYSVNDLNQYTAIGGQSLTYTTRGDVATHAGKTFTYDAFGNLIRAQTGAADVQYFYDGFGERVGKQMGTSAPVWWIHDGWDLIEEWDSGAQSSVQYIYEPGIDRPLAKVSGSTMEYLHQDVLGNVVAVTDAAGDVVETVRYDIWGGFDLFDELGDPKSGPPVSQFLFTGREWDSDVALYHYRARAYSPELGRFLQQDPIDFGGGDANIYRYVGNNPLSWIDPWGLRPGGGRGPNPPGGGLGPVPPENRPDRFDANRPQKRTPVRGVPQEAGGDGPSSPDEYGPKCQGEVAARNTEAVIKAVKDLIQPTPTPSPIKPAGQLAIDPITGRSNLNDKEALKKLLTE